MSKWLIGLIFMISASYAQAACEFDVKVTDTLAYSVTSMEVESTCDKVTVNLTHTGNLPVNAMGHNWVLAKSDDFLAVAQDGMSEGVDNNYLKAGDERVLAYTKLIGGGESTSVTFSLDGLSGDESYTFFCSFPGHTSIMRGSFTIK